MQLSLTQFQADLIKQSLKLIKLHEALKVCDSIDKMDYNNLLDKLADLSDTSRDEDFYKQSTLNRNGKDLDSL